MVAVIAAAALLATGGEAIEAQEQRADLSPVRDAYPQQVVADVEELLDRARGAGVPERDLADKALEGAFKRVPGERLVGALRHRLDRLEAASGALGRGADPAAIRAAADALGEGLTPEEVRRIGEVARTADRPAALIVLAELKKIGIPVGRGLEAVTRATEDEGEGGDLFAVYRRVRAAVRQGVLPDVALRAIRGTPPGPSGAPAGPPPIGFPAGPPVPPGSGPPGSPAGGGIPTGQPPSDPPPTGPPGSGG